MNTDMNTELSYLLDELILNWDENKPIQVKDLIKMIEKSFKKASQDQQQTEDFIDNYFDITQLK